MDRYRIPEAIERHNENHDDKLNSTKLAERINYKNFTLETKKSYIASASNDNNRDLKGGFIKELCRVLKCTSDFLLGISEKDADALDTIEAGSRKVDRLITKLQKVSSETIDNLNNMNKK